MYIFETFMHYYLVNSSKLNCPNPKKCRHKFTMKGSVEFYEFSDDSEEIYGEGKEKMCV